MPKFSYEAQNSAGQLVRGMVQCSTQRDAVRHLNEQSLLPLNLAEQTSARTGRVRVSAARLASLYQMLSDLLESGMPLLKSLELVAGQTSDAALAGVLTEINRRVADGETLSKALSVYAHIFDNLTCNMIRAGEEGGFLEESLRRLAALHQRRSALRSSLLGAIAYPAFLLIVGAVVVAGMMMFFVPKFEPLFDRLRASGQLPSSTSLLLTVSSLMRDYWLLLSVGLTGATAAIALWANTEQGKLTLDGWKLKLKIVGPVFTGAALSVYCRVLGTLLGNGVPMLQSLRIAMGTTGNRALQLVVDRAAKRVAAGGTLAENLSGSDYFPRELIEVIRIGEKSNRLDTVLIKLADQLDQRTQNYLNVLAKLIEPALMVVMAAVIGFMMLALLMPVFLSSGRFN